MTYQNRRQALKAPTQLNHHFPQSELMSLPAYKLLLPLTSEVVADINVGGGNVLQNPFNRTYCFFELLLLAFIFTDIRVWIDG